MSEYPKVMKHPHAKKGQAIPVDGIDPLSGKRFIDYQGSPDMFPPTTVNNERQEAEYRAKGYVEFSEPFPLPTEYRDYPKWLKHPTKDSVLANNPDQEREFIAQGYLLPGKSDPDAVSTAHASPYVAGRETKEFPKYVNGKIVDPTVVQSGPIRYPMWCHGQIVNNEAEELALRAKMEPAKEAAPTVPAEPAPTEPKFNRSEKMKAIWAAKKAAKAQALV